MRRRAHRRHSTMSPGRRSPQSSEAGEVPCRCRELRRGRIRLTRGNRINAFSWERDVPHFASLPSAPVAGSLKATSPALAACWNPECNFDCAPIPIMGRLGQRRHGMKVSCGHRTEANLLSFRRVMHPNRHPFLPLQRDLRATTSMPFQGLADLRHPCPEAMSRDGKNCDAPFEQFQLCGSAQRAQHRS